MRIINKYYYVDYSRYLFTNERIYDKIKKKEAYIVKIMIDTYDVPTFHIVGKDYTALRGLNDIRIITTLVEGKYHDN